VQKLEVTITVKANGQTKTFQLRPNRDNTSRNTKFTRVGLADKSPLLMSRQGVYIPDSLFKANGKKG